MKYWALALSTCVMVGMIGFFVPGCNDSDDDSSSETTTTTGGEGEDPAEESVALVAPAQTAPANGSTLSNFPRTVTMTWSTVPGAAKYGIQVQKNTGAWVDTANATISGTSYETTISGDNECRWRVWAIDDANNAGPMSGWSTFTFDTSA